MYSEIKESSIPFREKNDCTVIALSAATGHEYPTCHAQMETAGRKPLKGAKPKEVLEALNALGFKHKGHSITSIMENYPPKYRPKTITPSQVRMLPEVWKDGKTYICFTSSHALTIVDGEVIDWSDGRCHRIISVYEVLGTKYKAPQKQMELFRV